MKNSYLWAKMLNVSLIIVNKSRRLIFPFLIGLLETQMVPDLHSRIRIILKKKFGKSVHSHLSG